MSNKEIDLELSKWSHIDTDVGYDLLKRNKIQETGTYAQIHLYQVSSSNIKQISQQGNFAFPPALAQEQPYALYFRFPGVTGYTGAIFYL